MFFLLLLLECWLESLMIFEVIELRPVESEIYESPYLSRSTDCSYDQGASKDTYAAFPYG